MDLLKLSWSAGRNRDSNIQQQKDILQLPNPMAKSKASYCNQRRKKHITYFLESNMNKIGETFIILRKMTLMSILIYWPRDASRRVHEHNIENTHPGSWDSLKSLE